MTHTLPAPPSTADAAARWFARAQSGDMTEAERQALRDWLEADPRHRYEYDFLERLWQASAQVQPERVQRQAAAPRRRKFLVGAGATLALALAVAGGVMLMMPGDQRLELATGIGERKQLQLPDGSLLELNTRSQVRVRLSKAQRQVELVAGQVMFTVAHDSQRPFVVDVGRGSVTVTGTRFEVRRDDGGADVVVESGSVRVDGAPGPTGATAALTAGQRVALDAQGRLGPVTAADVDAVLAWRNGKLVFSNAALADVAREVSRYRPMPIVVDAASARLRLTGMFNTADPDSLLAALPQLLPVAVRRLPDGTAQVSAR